MNRIKKAIKNLEPLIDEAIDFEKYREQGRKPALELKQKVIILLLKELFGKTNRPMASMLDLFSLLSGLDFKEKRSGECRCLWRWHRLFFNDKKTLCIYRSEKSNEKKKAFVYSFKLLDIDVIIDSVRLDKYYSLPSYVDRFGETKVYVIPRKNATLKGSWKWKDTSAC